jgi:hypothetical protein
LKINDPRVRKAEGVRLDRLNVQTQPSYLKGKGGR